jgi:transposase
LTHFKYSGYSIIFCDEVTFSIKTFNTHAWSLPYQPFEYDRKDVPGEVVAVIASISYCRGVELVRMFKRSVNTKKFKTYLEELKQLHMADDIVIFLDQLSVHKSKASRERYDDLGMEVIFNAAYSPTWNPIENVFAIVKAKFKKLRLE